MVRCKKQPDGRRTLLFKGELSMRLKSTEEWDRSENLSFSRQLNPDFLASYLDRARQRRAKALAHLVRQALQALGIVFSRAGALKRTRSLSDTRRLRFRRAGSDNRISVGRFRTPAQHR
jgi:hypothetical protein